MTTEPHARRSDRVALLGDLVDSRHLPDRVSVQQALVRALGLEAPDSDADLADLARVTTGDEFQAIYRSWGSALAATYRLRLRLAGVVRIRVGLGRGDIVIIDPDRNTQDGSAWWSARAAIEEVSTRGSRRSHEGLLTGLRADPEATPVPALAQATVDLLDTALHGLGDRSLRVLAGLQDGRTQREIATQEGISASAVSQLVARDGLHVISETLTALAELP